ncbi:MAG: DUF2190 family protein [Myxococcota bacterium]
MKTLRQPPHPSQMVEHIAAAAITAGDVVLIAGGVGIAQDTVASGKLVTVAIGGQLQATPVIAAQAWTLGAKIYWDATPGEFTNVATANTLAGWAYRARASADTVGYIVILAPPGI